MKSQSTPSPPPKFTVLTSSLVFRSESQSPSAQFSTMLKLLAFLTLTLPFLTHSFSPDHPTDRRVLVLLDDLAIKSSHSLFFKTLQSRGFELDFKLADDPKIGLQRYGQYTYDALILFSPTVDRKSLFETVS